MYMFDDGGYMMGGVHGLWWILLLVVQISFVVICVWGQPGVRRQDSRDTPLDVLKRRLASGELLPEEYEKRKALLDGGGGGVQALRARAGALGASRSP
ncbi:MAG: putative membrane protein [Hydrogenophaga sp.]|jgi:putative membrane protein